MTESSSVRAHAACRERAEASPSCSAVLGRVSKRAGEKGGKRNPYQTAPTPSRSPGPGKEEKNLIQLWDAVDRQSTDI